MLSRYAHISPTHLWKAVEVLAGAQVIEVPIGVSVDLLPLSVFRKLSQLALP